MEISRETTLVFGPVASGKFAILVKWKEFKETLDDNEEEEEYSERKRENLKKFKGFLLCFFFYENGKKKGKQNGETLEGNKESRTRVETLTVDVFSKERQLKELQIC